MSEANPSAPVPIPGKLGFGAERLNTSLPLQLL